jgi:eukaryotic-like serine/threonine-protein kinase
MQYTPAVEDFLNCLRRSGLVDEDATDRLIEPLAQTGVDVSDVKAVAAALVKNQTLTAWQAENLLRGKRRGFLLGKYRLLSLLGRGASSSVYVAEHSLMHRRCAIKILPAKNLNSSSLARFQQEARASAMLAHSNIVRTYDLGQDKDGKTVIHFLVMELVDGESFEDRVTRDGPLPAVEAANLIRQSADGLAHAHAAGVIHRDIKPANLLVDRQGVVKILDLGLAKMSTLLSADDSAVMGTADFLAPEQALDANKADARSDIYSLGCTFYLLLSGRAPFPGGTLSERLVRHIFETPEPLAGKRPELPPDLISIVDRMLAKNPDDRIQTCAEVSEQLRNWLLKHADSQWLRDNPVLLGSGRGGAPSEPRAADLPTGQPTTNHGRPAAAAPVPAATPHSDAHDFIEIIALDENPSAAVSTPGFLDSEEFQMPISPVTRQLMQDRPEEPGWKSWLRKIRGQ